MGSSKISLSQMCTLLVLEVAKMAPGLRDASYLNYLSSFTLFQFEVTQMTNFFLKKRVVKVLEGAKISRSLDYEHI